MAQRYVTDPKGLFRVQYWGPEEYKGEVDGRDKYTRTHNAYYFDSEWHARAKYVELVTKQTLLTLDIEKVVFEVLFDYGGDDKLAFRKILESRTVLIDDGEDDCFALMNVQELRR